MSLKMLGSLERAREMGGKVIIKINQKNPE